MAEPAHQGVSDVVSELLSSPIIARSFACVCVCLHVHACAAGLLPVTLGSWSGAWLTWRSAARGRPASMYVMPNQRRPGVKHSDEQGDDNWDSSPQNLFADEIKGMTGDIKIAG